MGCSVHQRLLSVAGGVVPESSQAVKVFLTVCVLQDGAFASYPNESVGMHSLVVKRMN